MGWSENGSSVAKASVPNRLAYFQATNATDETNSTTQTSLIPPAVTLNRLAYFQATNAADETRSLTPTSLIPPAITPKPTGVLPGYQRLR